MNAIKLLESQHREVEALFDKIASTDDERTKEKLFIKLADDLAVHASIEEHHFYPAVKSGSTEDLVADSVEEHMAMKRVLSGLLDMEVSDEAFDEQLEELQQTVLDHVAEEESELFPMVARELDEETLMALGDAMSAEQSELLEKGNPRDAVPDEVDGAAP